MAKEVKMWETEHGDLFPTEIEAKEDELRTTLIKKFGLKEEDFDILERILEEPELQKVFSEWVHAQKAVDKLKEDEHKNFIENKQAKCDHAFTARIGTTDGAIRCTTCFKELKPGEKGYK